MANRSNRSTVAATSLAEISLPEATAPIMPTETAPANGAKLPVEIAGITSKVDLGKCIRDAQAHYGRLPVVVLEEKQSIGRATTKGANAGNVAETSSTKKRRSLKNKDANKQAENFRVHGLLRAAKEMHRLTLLLNQNRQYIAASTGAEITDVSVDSVPVPNIPDLSSDTSEE